MSDIIEAIRSRRLFGALKEFRKLDSWAAWMVALKAAFALPLDEGELEVYRRHTGRQRPPERPPRELWFVIGRRGGKSLMAALISVFLATFVKWPLGLERGYLMVIACDRRQAGVVFNYIAKMFALPAFKSLVARTLAEEIELKNGLSIIVQTASYRAVRGFQVVAVVLDETAFMRAEFTANPVGELLAALRPSLGGLADARLISISTGFAKVGPMWETYRDKFGVDDPETLVWAASTTAMNPTYSRKVIERALKADPQAQAVEYGEGVFFRDDLASYVSGEELAAVTVPGRQELPPRKGVEYVAGVDASGGRGDAMVLSIAHREKDVVVQDLVRGWFAPFRPADAVADFAAICKGYGVRQVVGDRFAASFHSDEWKKHGFSYKDTSRARSEYYVDLVPLIQNAKVELLDHPRQGAEFRQLLRRPGRDGRDSVNHPPGGSDDFANACAISVVEVSREEGGAFFGVLPDTFYPVGSDRYVEDPIDAMGHRLARALPDHRQGVPARPEKVREGYFIDAWGVERRKP